MAPDRPPRAIPRAKHSAAYLRAVTPPAGMDASVISVPDIVVKDGAQHSRSDFAPWVMLQASGDPVQSQCGVNGQQHRISAVTDCHRYCTADRCVLRYSNADDFLEIA